MIEFFRVQVRGRSPGASTHCLGHSQLAAHYNYQSGMIERC